MYFGPIVKLPDLKANINNQIQNEFWSKPNLRIVIKLLEIELKPENPIPSPSHESYSLFWRKLYNLTTELQLAMRAIPLSPTRISSTHLDAWVIWISRNQKIFQNRIFTPQETTLKILINAKGLKSLSPKTISHLQDRSQWTPTSVDLMRLGGKESQQPESRGPSTTQMERLSHLTANQSPLWLEMREAMEHAWSLWLTNLIFESDSKQLVSAVEGESTFSDLHGIVSDIISLEISFDSVSFVFRNRSNFVLEDTLAKQVFGLVVPTTFNWL